MAPAIDRGQLGPHLMLYGCTFSPPNHSTGTVVSATIDSGRACRLPSLRFTEESSIVSSQKCCLDHCVLDLEQGCECARTVCDFSQRLWRFLRLVSACLRDYLVLLL